ncbi:MAG: hypothetical protein HYS13_06525 [Planctomycetia bacterium]|nr:hypothetical protein [Planctomycetia bacterium]
MRGQFVAGQFRANAMNASHGDAGPALAAGKETVATLEPPGPALELQSNALPPQSAPRGPRPASRLARVRVTVYRATKTAFAVILLAAAVLKARQFLFEPMVGDASGWYTRIHLGLVFLELTLGAFLLANWWPRTTRFVAIGLLGGFAWLNFNQASCGAGTCPCFGEVTVSPWASFGIDLGFLAGFVIPMPAALKASVYASSLVASRWALALRRSGIAGIERDGAPADRTVRKIRDRPRPGGEFSEHCALVSSDESR